MASIYDTVSDLFSGELDLRDLKKSFDKALITAVYAPLKKGSQGSLVKTADKKIETAASETKTAIESLAAQLDTGIKGQGSRKIAETVEDCKADYDEI